MTAPPNTSGNTINTTKSLFLRGFNVISRGGVAVNLGSAPAYHGISQCMFSGNSNGIVFYGSDYANPNKLALTNCLFSGGTVSLVSGSNPTASAATGQFLFDTDDGRLLWDADGTGSGAAVLVATLSNLPSLHATDFVVGF